VGDPVSETTQPLVVLVGHGSYPEGALDAIEMILGPQEGLHAVAMRPEQDPSEVVDRVREISSATLTEEGGRVLLLVDLFGGSPANALAAAFLTDSRVAMVTGFNLSMLLELLVRRKRPDADLVQTALAAGPGGIIDVVARLRQQARAGS
jgi:mannose/fructose/sorbose-specific phosphotransferase system IIA component